MCCLVRGLPGLIFGKSSIEGSFVVCSNSRNCWGVGCVTLYCIVKVCEARNSVRNV